MKICGLHSGHDCSFAVLDDGIPVIHHELERFTRVKMVVNDALSFLFEAYPEYNEIDHFIHNISNWHGGLEKRYEKTFKKARSIGEVHLNSVGHHQSHAANAFFSSNYKNALIITVDGGGEDFDPSQQHLTSVFSIWVGKDNKITPLKVFNDKMTFGGNLGTFWWKYTSRVFGLSIGSPIGDQSGTVMAMAAYGDPYKIAFVEEKQSFIQEIKGDRTLDCLKMLGDKDEENKFHIAAAMQIYLEENIKKEIDPYMKKYKPEVLCLAGGTVLNSVMIGKLYDWYSCLKKIYIPPAPYDAGCAMGSAQWLWHHKMNQPRIKWEDNFTPYTGYAYSENKIKKSLNKYNDKVEYRFLKNDDHVIELLNNQQIISVYGGKSETGKRALGNRSILADPRQIEMKDKINKKVKHRQWFRPFAPSILREDVKDWFERDVDSPYMFIVLKFRKNKVNKVPAVVHKDGTARLQTVTETDNWWFYNFIKKWKTKTGIPILLNTSFNDREPIVETPENALHCFLGTEIDYLYFYDYQILVERKK